MTQLIQYFDKNGKDATWYEIAVACNILPEGTRKQRADRVRKFYNRTYLKKQSQTIQSTSDPILEEFKLFLRSKQTSDFKPYKGDPNNILIIGDTHIPYQHPDYLKFVIDIQKKWNCGKVIHIGDLVDFSSTTNHDLIPELPSPRYEFEITRFEIEKWSKAFPELIVTIGNHDRRVARKMKSNQIDSIWQKSFNDVFQTNWKFLPDYFYNGIYFCHGEGCTARITALQKQCSVVQGHRHSETYIDFPAKNLFAVQTPVGVNRETLAFDYARVDPKEWTLGATVILNNSIPLIEKL